jgi:hypothetical protein
MCPILLQAVAVVTVAFTKEALKKVMGPLEETLGRSSEARAGTTGEAGRRWHRVRAGRSPGSCKGRFGSLPLEIGAETHPSVLVKALCVF